MYWYKKIIVYIKKNVFIMCNTRWKCKQFYFPIAEILFVRSQLLRSGSILIFYIFDNKNDGKKFHNDILMNNEESLSHVSGLFWYYMRIISNFDVIVFEFFKWKTKWFKNVCRSRYSNVNFIVLIRALMEFPVKICRHIYKPHLVSSNVFLAIAPSRMESFEKVESKNAYFIFLLCK